MNRLQIHATQIYTLILTVLAISWFDCPLLALALVVGWALQGISLETLIHRKYAHNQFDYRNIFWEFTAYLILLSTGVGRPAEWAYGHRVHHRYTDLPEDPQSPHSIGWVKCALSIFPTNVPGWPGIIDDVLSTRRLMLFNRYYYWLYLAYNLAWFAISPELAVYFIGIPSCLAWISFGIVNTQSHRLQGQPNNIGFPLWFWGGNYHLEHHINPHASCLGPRDLSWYVIKLIAGPSQR
jgi:stearoyl-CoA desaturase (delta-9 desaturase)